MEKLGNRPGFPRAGSALGAVAVFPVGPPAAREMAAHVPFTDSTMKMLPIVHECVCGGALAGPACPQAAGSPAGVGTASPLRPPDSRERAVPMRTRLVSLKARCSLCVTPRFLPRTFWTGIQAPCPKQKEKNSSFNSATQQN